MTRLFAATACAVLTAFPALADFVPISSKDDFLATLEGRELRLGVFQIAIQITPDGQINGSALGWDMSGTWVWEDGYFCREIDWSGEVIPYNCQLVEVDDGEKMRFTVDRGAGDEATFNLR